MLKSLKGIRVVGGDLPHLAGYLEEEGTRANHTLDRVNAE